MVVKTLKYAATTMFNVTRGNTYLLRVINAAVNFQLYFGVAGHNLTVVEADGIHETVQHELHRVGARPNDKRASCGEPNGRTILHGRIGLLAGPDHYRTLPRDPDHRNPKLCGFYEHHDKH